MPCARIYKPSRSAMQQGAAKTKRWLLEFEPAAPRSLDPLMGWISSADTRPQVRLYFKTREDAVAYAEANGIEYRLAEPKPRKLRKKSYADNFRYDKVT